MKRLKLLWFRWRLRREYNKHLRMEEQFDEECGKRLQTHIFPFLEGQRKKVIRLMAICKELE